MGFAKLRLQSYGSLVFGVTSQSPFPLSVIASPFQKFSATNVKIINTILYVCQHEKIQEIIPS